MEVWQQRAADIIDFSPDGDTRAEMTLKTKRSFTHIFELIGLLHENNLTLQESITNLQTENLRLQAEITSLKTENTTLQNSLSALQTEISQLKSRITELENKDTLIEQHDG